MAPVTVTQPENSEVLPTPSEAVAVTNVPGGIGGRRSAEKEAFPAESAPMLGSRPTDRPPSPCPDGSQPVLAKNSTLNLPSGVLFSVPWTVTAGPQAAAVRTGEFCRLLAPVSGSPASFAVTPIGDRSMPRPALPTIAFPSISFPVRDTTKTPAP